MWQEEAKKTVLPEGPVGGDAEEIGVFPLDTHNATLLDQVAPKDWINPTPAEGFVYDLIALGAGAGGLVSSRQTARRGYKSALIEKHLAGGDCLNIGCVPSKALIRCARAMKAEANKGEFGITSTAKANLDFGAVMERMRRIRAVIAPADSYAGSVKLGVDMYQGHARFTSPNTVEVGGRTLTFRKAVIATGGSAWAPPIPGLSVTPYLTNNSLFNLTTLPKKFVVLGGGPIGVEMAQAFAGFGSQVTIVSSELLPREDPDARELLKEALTQEGVKFELDCKVGRVDHSDGVFTLTITNKDNTTSILTCDNLLVATGRAPNVNNLGLEAANVEYSVRGGIKVNDVLVSSNPNIYAVGDVAGGYQFTHVAGRQAMMVVDNAMFGESHKVSDMVVPWCTYTEPEVAHVGKYAHQVPEGVDTYKAVLDHNDRALCEGANRGFFKVHCLKGTDKIVGATIVCENAGEMLAELTLCVQFGIGLGRTGLGQVIHSYPTISEAAGSCAFQYKMKNWQHLKDGKVVGGEIVEKSVKNESSVKEREKKSEGPSSIFFGQGLIVGFAAASALFASLVHLRKKN